MEKAREKLKEAERAYDLALVIPNPDRPDKLIAAEEAVTLARRALKQAEIEDRKPKPHPALQVGPITQTVAIMAALTTAMSVIALPPDAIEFYYMFRQITVVAVLAHVGYSSIIWYGYTQALGKIPTEKPKDKIKEMLTKIRKPERPDPWANPRAHPSQFLTTRNAPPRLFPFPLGKTKPDAAVKDELWWEGGNAPHVGHFNRVKLDEPGSDPNRTEEVVMQKVRKQMEIEDQEKLWKRRIRAVQTLCVVVILNFINQKVAVVALIWLIYTTLSTELDNMLKPPLSMDKTYKMVDSYIKADKNQKFGVASMRQGMVESSMAYIYDQDSVHSKPASTIPIAVEEPHVLLTTADPWLAGPGFEPK